MEQALVFASIILGVAVAFELGNLNQLIRSDKVKWHWAQALFALLVLLTITAFWWMIARQPEGEISLARFLPVMFVLVLLTLLAAASLPDKIPDEGLDLANYYMSQRRYQWGLFLMIMAPLGINWLIVLARRGEGFGYVVANGWGEVVPMLAITWLIFANRWWKVGVGYVVLSITPLAWLSRTL